MHRLVLQTSKGTFELEGSNEETVLSCLRKHGIPLSAVSLILARPDGTRSPISALSIFGNQPGIVNAYLNRNLDITPENIRKVRSVPLDQLSTEYLGPLPEVGSINQAALVQMTSADVFVLATETVQRVFDSLGPALTVGDVIVGFSGGGDSNLLLAALTKSEIIPPDRLRAVMVLGIEDWDRQLEIAKTHAANCKCDLIILTEEKASKLAALDSIENTRCRFKTEFPNTNLEFFGTWLIRRVLSRYADLVGAKVVVLGGNREDTLAEALYQISIGAYPMPFPVRKFGDIIIVNPLYQLPKRVIDGAFWDYSLRNYQHRNPSGDRGRSLFYKAAYSLGDHVPGMDLSLLEGLSRLASNGSIVWDPTLGDYVHSSATDEIRKKWARVLNRST